VFNWDILLKSAQFIGSRSINWHQFADSPRSQGFLYFTNIASITDIFRKGYLEPLWLLRMTRDSEVSDPRDKLIRLLSLLPQSRGRFRCDYSLSKDELFHHFAGHLLRRNIFIIYKKKSYGAEMLSYAGLQRKNPSSNLPSWVPDWTYQSTYVGLMWLISVPENSFAAGTTDSYPFMISSYPHRPDELHSGLLFEAYFTDRLSFVSDQFPSERASTPEIKVIDWIDKAWGEFEATTSNHRHVYDNPKEVFCRILIINNVNTKTETVFRYPQNQDLVTAHAEALEALAALSRNDGPFSNTRATTYLINMLAACNFRSFATTENSFAGLVPGYAKAGDRICIIHGAHVSFIVRENGVFAISGKQRPRYTLVGEAYIDGIMNSEALKNSDFGWELSALF
jgi:hypothetical protein